jgi:uncharacterized metal-binding protein
MPLAQTHDKIGGITALILFPASSILLQRYGSLGIEEALRDGAILTAAHLFGTYFLSPDLDTDSAIDKRWGPLRIIWRPYTVVVPHRAIWSHSGLSGLLRLIYLAIMLIGLLWALSGALVLIGINNPSYHIRFVNWLQSVIFDHPRTSALIGFGVVISDLVHTIADHISTEGKRLRRQMFGSKR